MISISLSEVVGFANRQLANLFVNDCKGFLDGVLRFPAGQRLALRSMDDEGGDLVGIKHDSILYHDFPLAGRSNHHGSHGGLLFFRRCLAFAW